MGLHLSIPIACRIRGGFGCYNTIDNSLDLNFFKQNPHVRVCDFQGYVCDVRAREAFARFSKREAGRTYGYKVNIPSEFSDATNDFEYKSLATIYERCGAAFYNAYILSPDPSEAFFKLVALGTYTFELQEQSLKSVVIMVAIDGGDSVFHTLPNVPNNELEGFLSRMLSDVLYILASCHTKNILHRDIKCENIVFDKTQGFRLIDWAFSSLPHNTYCGTPGFYGDYVKSLDRNNLNPVFENKSRTRTETTQLLKLNDQYAIGMTIQDCLEMRGPDISPSFRNELSIMSRLLRETDQLIQDHIADDMFSSLRCMIHN